MRADIAHNIVGHDPRWAPTFSLAGKSNSVGAQSKFAEASAMSLTRKAPTAAKKKDKPQRQGLAQALAEREAELAEARRQQAATAEILKVIASSPNDLQPVLDKIVETACRLCSAYDALALLHEGDQLRVVAHYGPIPVTFASEAISPGLLAGRAVIERQAINIDDIAKHTDEYPVAAALASRGVAAGSGKMLWRANLVVPLMREGEAVGVIGLRRAEAVPFSEGQIELLKTFSDQAVIAIQNARLFDEVQAKTRDLEDSLTQQTATADVLKAISRTAFDLDTVLETLISTAARLCDAKHGQIFRRHGDAYRYAASQMEVSPAYLQHEQAAEIRPGRGTLIGRVALESRTVEIADAWNDPEYAEKDEVRETNLRAMLGVPLMRDGDPIGAFALARSEPIPFTPRQVELVTTFADQAVIAIENVRLFDEVQAKTRDLEESLQQQTATANVLKVISRSAFDLKTVLRTLIRSAVELSGSLNGVICLRKGDLFYFEEASGMSAKMVQFLKDRPQAPGRYSMAARVALSGNVETIPDVLADPEYIFPANTLNRTRSLLGAPLMRNDRVEGVFILSRPEPGEYPPRLVELVRTFADQAVIAIENVRLFDEVQARTRDLEESLQQRTATADVLKVISRSAFDLQAVLHALVESAAKLCDADMAAITREIDGVLYRAESYGFSDELMSEIRRIPIAPERGTVMGRVLLEGKPIQIDDVLADPEYTLKDYAKMGAFRTCLGIPMLRDGVPIGVISLLRTEARAFNDKQIELVQTFADQAVIAIENARLFDEVQARTRDLTEALERQTATSEILRVISQSPTDARPVFDSIVLTAARLLRCDTVFVLLREGDAYAHIAGATPEGPIADFAPRRFPIDPTANFPSRAILAKDMLHLPDWSLIDLPEHEAHIHETLGFNSALYLPLLRGDECIGLLVLGGRRANIFGPSEIAQAESFRDQALIAIQNARLFDEVQARTRDLQESLQQQTATADVLKVISRSAFDLPAVLRTLVESAAKLCDADKATITREINGVYYRAESYGFSEEFMGQIRNIPVAPERGSITGRVMLEGKAIQVEDVDADPNYWPKNFEKPGELRTGLGIPMMRNGAPIGVLALMRTAVRPFNAKQIELVQTFADQAVIAIENARLFDEVQAKTRDLEESLQQQTATADVLKVISRSAFDLQAVFDALISSAVDLIGSQHGTIYVREGDGFRIRAHRGVTAEFVDFLVKNPPAPGMGSASGRVMLTGKVVVIPDILEDKDYTLPANELNRTRAMLGAPLLRNDRVEGVLVIARTEPGAFSSRQIELVQTFADQAVIAIENARLFDEVQAKTRDLQETLEQQTASAEILRVISSSPTDVQPVFDAIAHSAAILCEATNGTVFRLRDGLIHLVGYYSLSQAQLASVQHAFPAPLNRGTASGRAILECGVVHIRDIAADPEYSAHSLVKTGLRSVLSVPMLRNGEPIGSINVSRDAVRPFSERQIELLKTFADQAVIAINNVGLFNETREALEQQKATADVLKVISRSAFDLDAVLQTLTHSARSLSGAASADVEMLDGDVLRIRAQSGCDPELVKYIEEHPPRRGTETVAGRVLMTGEAVHIPDVRADTDYDFGEGPQIGNFRALLGAPLIRDGKVDGVFTLMRPEPGAFTPRQIELVQTFADQAVIAIENARLFDEVQAKQRDLAEALEHQTATSEVLSAISRSPTEVQPVFDAIARSATELCGATSGGVDRFDGELIHLASHYNWSPEALQAMGEIYPATPSRGFASARSILTRSVVHIPDISKDPEYTATPVIEVGFRSVLAVPMLRDGQPIGSIALVRLEPRPFTDRQVALLQTFAEQAVIAVNNVRLFDEVQAKTRDLEESLQQQTATADVLKVISRSAFDLQAVLTTLAESARDLCGASFVTLSLREGDAMRLRAESGCTPEIVQFMSAHPIRAGRETFTGRVMLSGEAVHLPDVLADPEYDFGEGPRIGNYRALLGVPLLRNGQVEGVFALARPEPVSFTERQIEMVRAFADQAVIAIENARLFNEVQARTRELAASLDDLRKAQDRLIQSEKLASLGQLTAGIAHEIKNPLNFINNYSALSRELVDELADAIKGGAVNEAAGGEVDELLGAVGGNLDKIVQHGKRADSIVKNMLLHSREGSGERSTTNVNTMVEEALNLAYHGARAEKPGFNVTIVKSLDPNAGTAEVYAQEMTRVLLNLISNGFYATSKRKQSAGNGAYEPTISASTRDLGPKVEIAIRDNGTGIPDEVKAKMFNPFFTTKPAGEGTGLGLSLSHDIVVKQHGGVIEVATEPDAFTEFTIVLPRGAARL
jgi:GAF domain-containing protein